MAEHPTRVLGLWVNKGAVEGATKAIDAMEDEGRGPGSSAFGALLRGYRLAAGLSQQTLAERARMSTQGVGALERGDRRTPQRETLALLAGALGLSDDQRRAFEDAAKRAAVVRRSSSLSVGLWPDTTIASLPFALTSFVGREAELAEITALVREHRMVTLTGAGGVGKTQTALHVATALSDAGDDGVCFIALAPVGDPSLVVSTIASTLGVQEAPTRQLLETLIAYLKNRALLLILDNCEHVIAQASILAEILLGNCPRVRILSTSREPLKAAGEYSYRLPSLSSPSPGAARNIRATDAVAFGAIALFADRAKAAEHRFTVTDENAPIVADVCRRLDGIPLAIELAAVRVNLLSVKALAQKLDDRFRLLTGGERTALPRQQTMRAAIDWSHDLLEEREPVLFRRLGIFVNGFVLEGAVAVGSGEELNEPDVFDALASLVDKSLVLAELQGDVVRYRLLESTRAYASEKLDDAGERDLVAGRHLRYLRDRFAELREERERTARGADLDAALETDLDDARSALDGALARSEVNDGGELLVTLARSWAWIGLDAEWMRRCEAYLAALPADQSRLRAQLLSALSYLLDGSGQRVRGFAVATQAVEQARASGDGSSLARALSQYANMATFLHRFDEAETALVEAEAIRGTSADLRMRLLDARARLSQFRGDLETAVHMFEQARKEHHSLGNTGAELLEALNLAEIEHRRGETQRAITIVRETLAGPRAGTDKTRLVLLNNFAGYLAAADDLSGAVAAAREAIGILVAHEPDHAHVAIAIEHLALVVALCGDRARAATLEGYADSAFGRHGFEREFTEITTHGRLLALLREGLTPEELARLMAEGAALTPEAAIALVLEEC
jgi:predicted ATPase/DNA-binding XRE family transcriptional regulator